MIEMTRKYQHDDLKITVYYTNEDLIPEDCDGMTTIPFEITIAITNGNGTVHYAQGYTEWEPNDANDAPCYERVAGLINDLKERISQR